jgi:hypothetical protein
VKFLFGDGGKAEVGIAGGDLFFLRSERVLVERGILAGKRTQRSGDVLQLLGVAAFSTGCDLVEEGSAYGKSQGDILRRQGAYCWVNAGRIGLCGKALPEVGAPGVEVVHPCLYGKAPRADPVYSELSGPKVVGQRSHGRGVPVLVGVVLVEKAGVDVIVAIGEDGRGDCNAVAQETASRGTAAIDLGLDVFEDGALSAFSRFHSVPIF